MATIKIKHIFLRILIIVSIFIEISPFKIPYITQKDQEDEISQFVSSLISINYQHCKLFLLEDGLVDHSGVLTDIITDTGLSYYNVKVQNSLAKTQVAENQSGLSTRKVISHNRNKSLPTFSPSISHHHKRSGQCFFVVLMINDIQPEFLHQLFNLITPVYIPITRKDEDYYVFITKPELAEELLLMKELPAKIKFKLSISNVKRNSLLIQTVCFFCDNGSPKIIRFNQGEGIANYFPDFVLNLNGKTLRVSIPAMQSRIQIDKQNENGIKNAKRGLWKSLFEDFLVVKFNFTYTMFMSTGKDGNVGGGGTGLQLKNGTWVGVVGDIASGKAEVGILASKTPKRIYYMDTSDAFFDVTYLTFVTSQGQQIFTAAALFWPFDTWMWVLIISSTLLAFVIFKMIIKSIGLLGISNSSNLLYARRGILSKESWSISHQIQFILTSFLDQDCVMPESQPLRCFVALWLFFTLIITSVYRSKLVSLMAFPVLQAIPKTFAELAFSDFEVGFMKHGDSAYNTLAASTDPVYVKLIAEMEVVTGLGLDCLEKVVQRRYACIAYEFSLIYLRERNLSDSDIRKLVKTSDHTYNIWTGLNFEGRSIYKRNFDKWLRLTRPMHFADIWERDDMYYNVRLGKLQWWNETKQLENNKMPIQDESQALSFQHAIGAFTAFSVGIVISLIIFLVEFFLLCFKEKNAQQRRRITRGFMLICEKFPC